MRGVRDPSRPVVTINTTIPPAVWSAVKALARANRSTVDRIVAAMLEECLTRAGVDLREDHQKESPESVAKVEPVEVQGPTPSRMSRTLDPLRYVKG